MMIKRNTAPLFKLKKKTIINETETNEGFESIYSTIVSYKIKLCEKVQSGILIVPQIVISIFQSTIH